MQAAALGFSSWIPAPSKGIWCFHLSHVKRWPSPCPAPGGCHHLHLPGLGLRPRAWGCQELRGSLFPWGAQPKRVGACKSCRQEANDPMHLCLSCPHTAPVPLCPHSLSASPGAPLRKAHDFVSCSAPLSVSAQSQPQHPVL